MIRRRDAPLSTHVDYRIQPVEWLIAVAALLALTVISIAAMGLTP